MSIRMNGNRIAAFLRRGTSRRSRPKPLGPWFQVASNLYGGFEIGVPGSTNYYLRAYVSDASREIMFDGQLLLSSGRRGPVLDGFPAGSLPEGWAKRIRADGNGYDVVDAESGNTIFGYKVVERVCVVTANIYDETGSMIAESLGDDFVVRILPFRLGDVRFVKTTEEA